MSWADAGEKPKATLEYAPRPARRGVKYWAAEGFWRLGKPMSLGMYYVITFVLSVVATILALIVAAVVHWLR